ncbi:Innexin inx4, partial [Stegodyphus mimosarum]
MWVNLFILVQAFIFYLPHLLWISYDMGYTGKLTSRARKYSSSEEKHVHQLELRDIAEYLLATKGKHTLYTSMYIIFEACNFAVASLQTLWLVNFFGVAGLAEDLPAEIDTWSEFWDFYFPDFGFCELRKLTPAVDVQFHTTCLLPLNTLYVKMFLILLVWYVLLTFLSGMVLIYRIAHLMPSFRKTSITFWAPLVDPSTMKDLLRETYSDWFFLSRLQKTVTDTDFAQLVREVSFMSSYNALDRKEADDNRSSLSNKNKSLNDSSSNVHYRVASPHGISAL